MNSFFKITLAVLAVIPVASACVAEPSPSGTHWPSVDQAQMAIDTVLTSRGHPEHSQKVLHVLGCMPSISGGTELRVCSVVFENMPDISVNFTFRNRAGQWKGVAKDQAAACPPVATAQKLMRESSGDQTLVLVNEIDDGVGLPVIRVDHTADRAGVQSIRCRYLTETDRMHIVYVSHDGQAYVLDPAHH